MSVQRVVSALLVAAMATAFSCSYLDIIARASSQEVPDDAALAKEIARAISAACPITSGKDHDARDRAAANLATSDLLCDAMAPSIFWGGHTPDKSYRPEENHATQLNPFVWRRMYLSLFTFTGEHRIEREGSYTVVHLPCRFRGGLDMGAYPYPFWHSEKKWAAYHRTTEVLLVIEQGKIIGGYRSGKLDPKRPYARRQWDGKWHWTEASGREMPYATLYRWLFSPSNPHVSRLDIAYRALEAELRPRNCVNCHSPDNSTGMKSLVLINYPNQALSARHSIVRQLQQNRMPPGGIVDGAERKKLIEMAESFAEAADKALEYEGEPQPAWLVSSPSER